MPDAPVPIPDSFIDRIQAQLGVEDAAALIKALDEKPHTSIRRNPYKSAALKGEPVPWNNNGLYLKERPQFVKDPFFHAGAYYVQEASSMILEAVLPAVDKPLRILDLCAAPGGKSTLLAAAMHPESILVSNEVIYSRAKILAENMTRWGVPNVIVTHSDPRELGQLEDFFDLIVVDAPCSGEGMFRKDVDSRSEWSTDNVALCAARQTRILNDILPALAPGGSLIYSTCTFNEHENASQLLAALEENNQLTPFPINLPAEWNATEILHDDQKAYAWQCFPHRMKGEGLFVGRLKDTREPEAWGIRSEASSTKSKKKKKGKGKGRNTVKTQRDQPSVPELLQEWVWMDGTWPGLEAEVHEENLKVFSPQEKFVLPHLQQEKIHIIQAGTVVGKLHRKGLNPSHELALSTLVNPALPTHELDLESALRYLKKEDLVDPGATKGFFLATYQGVVLGWLKGIQGKWKNYLPINWRIRK